jgi:hypothetical protein
MHFAATSQIPSRSAGVRDSISVGILKMNIAPRREHDRMEQATHASIERTLGKSSFSALIIDDDAGVRQSLRLCLEAAGARVLGVATAAAAFESAPSHKSRNTTSKMTAIKRRR